MHFIEKSAGVFVAATAAAAIGFAFTSPVAADDGEDKTTGAAVLAAEISPGEALAAAEKETGGRVIELEFETEDGKSFYEIELAMADGSVREVLVDPMTGQINEHDDVDRDDDDDDESDDDD